jgi:hypothetical protein
LRAFTFMNHSQIIGAGFQQHIDIWRIFVYLYINFQAPCHPHQLGRYQLDCDADNRRLHARLVSQITALLIWVWSSAAHVFQYSDFFHEILWKIFTFYNFHILNGFSSEVTIRFLTQRIQYKSREGKNRLIWIHTKYQYYDK